MYCLVPEKPLRLAYETFYLAIGDTFYGTINFYICEISVQIRGKNIKVEFPISNFNVP